jgi:hypothetical protein
MFRGEVSVSINNAAQPNLTVICNL